MLGTIATLLIPASAVTYVRGLGPEALVVLLLSVAWSYFIDRLSNGRMDEKTKAGLAYNREFLDRARKVKDFPPPYPNTWYFVMRSEQIKKGEVQSLQLLGREMVAFRDHNGKVGIIHAFCPHLGAHLGKGGKVNDKNLLVCPFHEWGFDTEGKCKQIPYCTKDISQYNSIHQKAYIVEEKYQCIWLWYHSDGEKPTFQVEMHTINHPCRPADKLIRRGSTTLFNMHMMEPSLNTQDWYHFGTTHKNLAWWSALQTYHTVRDTDFRNDGTFDFFEDMDTSLFGLPKYRVPELYNKIKFCGPAIAVINSQYGDKVNTTFATFTPIAPFKTKVDFTTFTSSGWYGLWKYASLVVGYTQEHTVKQDIVTWEHKGNPTPKRLVPGDRAGFNQYRKWLEQFYTESSNEQKTLEW